MACDLAVALLEAATLHLKPVTEEEYGTLPSFVKTQLEREYANEVLGALHECISTSGILPQEALLTATQLQ